MPTAASDDSDRPHGAARELFDRALSLPPEQRAAFIRREARDDAMAEQVLSLLRGAGQDTAELAAQARVGDPRGAGDAGSDAASPSGERVQSTATGELLKKLATAPKLDTQRFQLEGELGKGGMGVVLRVHDQFLNRRLAMKVLLERATPRDEEEKRLVHQLLGRFLEEAQVTSQLDHPGVIPVHELGLDQSGKVYFTMRMVKGSTASERFEDAFHGRGEWNLTRGLEVILRVCDTMAYAHDKGVLHRDLKPSNVMVGRFGEVYVMDWGLAKVLGQQDRHDLRIRKDGEAGVSQLDTARKRDTDTDAENSVVSMDGQLLGTPSYMSPEQARSEELDERADVYSIGAMMYELATGRAPYSVPGLRKPAYRILEDVLQRAPERIEALNNTVPAELVAVIDKAMAREHEQRYRTVQELSADVRAFMAHRVVTAYRTGAWQETKLWVRRNKPLAASMTAAVLLLFGGIVGVTAYAQEAKTNELAANAAKQDALAQKQIAERNAEAAQEQAVLARTAKQEADGKAQALAEKVAEFDQLALVVDYERLMTEESDLDSAYPDQAGAIADWLHRAQRLLGQRDALAAGLSAVKSAHVSKSGDDAASASRSAAGDTQQRVASAGASSSLTFASSASSLDATLFLTQSLGNLLGKLPHLEKLVPTMQQRLRWAEAIGPLTSAHPNAGVTLAQARAAIAASPNYRGLDLPLEVRDLLGLVPIGENPHSRLWEFYDLRSAWDGTSRLEALPIPSHEPDGRIKVTGETGIVWVLLPGGKLPLGTADSGNKENTSVRLDVHLDPFFLAKHEITQGQWQRWNGNNPTSSKNDHDLRLPIESVSWSTCHETLLRFGLELPSELQWEYGIRGGTPTKWWTGDSEVDLLAAENIGKGTERSAVGTKKPNPFGLLDMGGNVMEWCYDEYSAYGTELRGDGRRPDPPSGPVNRPFRGGCFGSSVANARSDIRRPTIVNYTDTRLGVRPARRLRR